MSGEPCDDDGSESVVATAVGLSSFDDAESAGAVCASEPLVVALAPVPASPVDFFSEVFSAGASGVDSGSAVPTLFSRTALRRT